MVSLSKGLILAVIFTSWVFLFGYSPNPLVWGEHAQNTLFPTEMLDLSIDDTAILDADFDSFCEKLGEIDYFIPSNWDSIPERMELKKLDYFFHDYFNLDKEEENQLSFDYYHSASWAYHHLVESKGEVVLIASYLIHRGYDAWVYFSATEAWVEVYLNSDWRSEYEFWGTDSFWIIKFNETVQIYSIVPYIGNFAINFTIIASVVLLLMSLLYMIRKAFAELDDFSLAYREIEWTRWRVLFVISMIFVSVFSILENLHLESLFVNEHFSAGSLSGFSIYIMELIRVTSIAVFETFMFGCLVVLIYIAGGPISSFLRELQSSLYEEKMLLYRRSIHVIKDRSVKIKDTVSLDNISNKFIRVTYHEFLQKFKRNASLSKIAILAVAVIITILTSKSSLSWVIIQFIVTFFLILASVFIIKHVLRIYSKMTFDLDDIIETIQLNIFTVDFRSLRLPTSAIKNTGSITIYFSKALYRQKNKIVAMVISWVFLFGLYWWVIQIILSLLGQQYSNSGVFQQEIEGNFLLINLFLVATFIGMTSGISFKIWNHGENSLKNLHRMG